MNLLVSLKFGGFGECGVIISMPLPPAPFWLGVVLSVWVPFIGQIWNSLVLDRNTLYHITVFTVNNYY